MLDLKVDRASCSGCGDCVDACGFGAIRMKDGFAQVHDAACARCMICVQACATGALRPVRAPGAAALADDAIIPPRVVSSSSFTAARSGGGRKNAVEPSAPDDVPGGSRLN